MYRDNTVETINFAIEKGVKIPQKHFFESKKSFEKRKAKFMFYLKRIRINVKEIEDLEKKSYINYKTPNLDHTRLSWDFVDMMEDEEFLKIDYSRKIEEIHRESKQKLEKAKMLFKKSKLITLDWR